MSRDLLQETKELLRFYDVKSGLVAGQPRNHIVRGQNFLICEDVLDSIVQAADIQLTDNILEIGPGLGILTNELVARAGKVLAIEYDRDLIPLLEIIKSVNNNFQFINNDVLEVSNQTIVDKLGEGYRVVANIPYQITSKIIKKFLTFAPQPKDLLLLVQKEVGERIVASAGQLSKLAISVQFYAQPEIVRTISKDCFWPAPKVDSALLKMVLHDKYLNILQTKKIKEKTFWSVVRAGFAGKRKTLVNNLSNSMHLDKAVVVSILQKCGLDKNVRAQELSIDNWIVLIINVKAPTASIAATPPAAGGGWW